MPKKYLDVQSLSTDDLQSHIIGDALKDDVIKILWDRITLSSSSPSDRHMLLRSVVKLCSTVRIHAYAEKVTDLFKKKQKKGTRKILKQQGTQIAYK